MKARPKEVGERTLRKALRLRRDSGRTCDNGFYCTEQTAHGPPPPGDPAARLLLRAVQQPRTHTPVSWKMLVATRAHSRDKLNPDCWSQTSLRAPGPCYSSLVAVKSQGQREPACLLVFSTPKTEPSAQCAGSCGQASILGLHCPMKLASKQPWFIFASVTLEGTA